MPAGSLFFPLLSPDALAAMWQCRNPSARAGVAVGTWGADCPAWHPIQGDDRQALWYALCDDT
jgi:hypothetical protein